ncbi:MAG: GNAT family N-acetyltransferase [Planctomycetota bacterium]
MRDERQLPRPTMGPVARFDHADSAWNRAVHSSRHADPFSCRTEWQLSFHEAMSPDRHLLVRTADDSMIAFAAQTDPRLGPLLEPIESSWLFGCPLLGPHAAELLSETLVQLHQHTPLPCLLISGLDATPPQASGTISPTEGRDTDLERRIRTQLGSRFEVFRLAPTTLVYGDLAGGLDGWLGRRTAKVRRNVRRDGRRLRDLGIRFERHSPRTKQESDAVYERMLAVESLSWKGTGRCGMAEEPSQSFYRLLLNRLAAGGLARIVIAHDQSAGNDAGFIFGGMHGGVYRGQQFSYAESWRAHSLGNVLQLEKVRWLAELGASRYDMGPMMAYKRHWAEHQQAMGALLLRPAE